MKSMIKALGINKKMAMIILLSGSIAAMILLINSMYFAGIPTLYAVINILALFILMFPIIMIKYLEYSRAKETEEMFPIFLRDFVEVIRGGMTVPQAFRSVMRNDYKSLSPYVKKMNAQLDWGIPVEKVMLNFSTQTKSKLIGRIVSSVVESHRFGGNLADTFEALSRTSLEVEKLRAERKLYLNSQMMTGYIIFFVFLAVIIGLEKFLTPTLAEITPASLGIGTGPISQEYLVKEYHNVYMVLIVSQGFFAGLAVGKMAEGTIIAGFKHSFVFMFVGALVFVVATDPSLLVVRI